MERQGTRLHTCTCTCTSRSLNTCTCTCVQLILSSPLNLHVCVVRTQALSVQSLDLYGIMALLGHRPLFDLYIQCTYMYMYMTRKVNIQAFMYLYQPGAHSVPGWSYSYFAILCLCLSVQSLGRPGNELMVAAGTNGCFELTGLFALASSLQRKLNDVSTIDSRGIALITQAQHRESSPRRTGMARNQRLTTNKPRSEIALVLQYSVSPK